MCGFGDKDRRPITPPPCIRLKVLDATTRREIDPNEIDISFFVLTVDLWNADGDREVNLVRHSATSPSISTATSSSYPPPPQSPAYPQPAYPPQAMYPPHPAYPQYYPPQQQAPAYNPQPGMAYPSSYYPMTSGYMTGTSSHALAPQPVMQHIAQPHVGMFTRNLIGSLSASAFRLTDPDNKLGIWFILQDLSVRTEGSFRLKMNFVDVGTRPQSPGQAGNGAANSSMLNHGSAPVLASVFSDVFHVYSAKKFPGVIESTPLSKCFAIQGIKIPIRKDGAKGARGVAAMAPSSAKTRESDEWDE
ncbi:hypothetical protein VTO42DRAFT_4123 [Malbranchea cinnamomea]